MNYQMTSPQRCLESYANKMNLSIFIQNSYTSILLLYVEKYTYSVLVAWAILLYLSTCLRPSITWYSRLLAREDSPSKHNCALPQGFHDQGSLEAFTRIHEASLSWRSSARSSMSQLDSTKVAPFPCNPLTLVHHIHRGLIHILPPLLLLLPPSILPIDQCRPAPSLIQLFPVMN